MNFIKLKSKLLRGTLALCLILAALSAQMIPPAAADDDDNNPELYNLWIGGLQVTSENRARISEVLAENGVDASGVANYDPDNGILTLDNFHLAGTGYSTSYRFHNGYTYGVEAMIYTTDPIQIDLWGDNEIIMRTVNAERFLTGINSRTDLTITGNNGANLTVKSGDPSSGRGANIYHTIGIQARDEAETDSGFKNLIISGDCDITAIGGDDGESFNGYHSRTVGLQAGNLYLQNGCEVIARAGSVTLDSYSCAVGMSVKTLRLSGGSFVATGDTCAITLDELNYTPDQANGYANTNIDGLSGESLPLEQWPEKFAQNDNPAYKYAYIHDAGSAENPENQLVYAVNISGAGGEDISNSSLSAFYQSADNFPENIQDAINNSDQFYAFRFRFMSPACCLPYNNNNNNPAMIYLKQSDVPTTHELILYSQCKLDPAQFTISTGARQLQDFTAGYYGDGDGVLYWYQTVIEIPANSDNIIILYQQKQAVYLNPVRVSNINAVYITQLFNAGFETNQNGEIISFTVEIAGLNLPTDPAAYSIENCTLQSLTGPDETGKLTLIFRHDDPGEIIHWKDLLINQKIPFYFDQHKIEINNNQYTCNNDTENGTYATLPTPYYTLKRGADLDQQSAPLIISNQENQILYADIIRCQESDQIFCASYLENGAMIDIDSNIMPSLQDAAAPLVFKAASDAFCTKLMIFNQDFIPRAAAQSVQ